MNNELSFLVFMILCFGGCSTLVEKAGSVQEHEPPLSAAVSPGLGPPQGPGGDPADFEDISLSAKARQQALTNRREIDRETDKYVNAG